MTYNDRYFRSSNFNVVAFLYAKGVALANIDKTANSRRATFVFVDTPERETLVHAFNHGKEDDPLLMIDARRMLAATRELKEKLYDENF